MPTPTNQTAIPSVTNLREQLGYSDAKRKIFHELKNAMLSSRDVFVTDEGLRGQDLIDWKSRDQQTALSKMLAPFAEMTPSSKRAREADSSSARSESSAKRGRKSSTQVASRSSTRQRKARREPEWATEEQYWAAGESPERLSSLGSIDNNLGVPGGAPVVTPTRPTVEDAPQEDPVNDFIDEWTMQQNADTEAILTTTDIPKDRAMALNTTREEEAAEKPDVAPGVLSVHPSTRALMSEPVVPEETAAKTGSQRSDNAESNDVDPKTVVAQPKFTYTIMTHYPKYRERHWKPKSGFRQKTLSELLTEFPPWVKLSDVESLQFLIETSNAEVEGVMELGQEEQFEEMKAKFEKVIRMEIARAASTSQVLVKISIDVRTGRDP
ncbi:hypothetical protein CBS470a_007295 [Colletotrichum nupharicola]|nr:hypothetical protein CBS470a_007295 [Colletotrichum nupharicola]